MVGYAVSIHYAIAAAATIWWCRHSERANMRVRHIVAASAIEFLDLRQVPFCPMPRPCQRRA